MILIHSCSFISHQFRRAADSGAPLDWLKASEFMGSEINRVVAPVMKNTEAAIIKSDRVGVSVISNH